MPALQGILRGGGAAGGGRPASRPRRCPGELGVAVVPKTRSRAPPGFAAGGDGAATAWSCPPQCKVVQDQEARRLHRCGAEQPGERVDQGQSFGFGVRPGLRRGRQHSVSSGRHRARSSTPRTAACGRPRACGNSGRARPTNGWRAAARSSSHRPLTRSLPSACACAASSGRDPKKKNKKTTTQTTARLADTARRRDVPRPATLRRVHPTVDELRCQLFGAADEGPRAGHRRREHRRQERGRPPPPPPARRLRVLSFRSSPRGTSRYSSRPRGHARQSLVPRGRERPRGRQVVAHELVDRLGGRPLASTHRAHEGARPVFRPGPKFAPPLEGLTGGATPSGGACAPPSASPPRRGPTRSARASRTPSYALVKHRHRRVARSSTSQRPRVRSHDLRDQRVGRSSDAMAQARPSHSWGLDDVGEQEGDDSRRESAAATAPTRVRPLDRLVSGEGRPSSSTRGSARFPDPQRPSRHTSAASAIISLAVGRTPHARRCASASRSSLHGPAHVSGTHVRQ